MDGYRLKPNEAEVLAAMTRADGSKYNPVRDVSNSFFIFEEEYKETGLGTRTKYVPSPRIVIPDDTHPDKVEKDVPEHVNDPRNKYETKKSKQ